MKKIKIIQLKRFKQKCLENPFTIKLQIKQPFIACNHIFSDGNKRTGLEAALAFLKLNGNRLNKNLPYKQLFDYNLKVAS
jgi:hypothetical protein